jgi:hypothetical protein
LGEVELLPVVGVVAVVVVAVGDVVELGNDLQNDAVELRPLVIERVP